MSRLIRLINLSKLRYIIANDLIFLLVIRLKKMIFKNCLFGISYYPCALQLRIFDQHSIYIHIYIFQALKLFISSHNFIYLFEL